MSSMDREADELLRSTARPIKRKCIHPENLTYCSWCDKGDTNNDV